MLVVVHFHNGTGGGVLSVIRNILKYKQHPQIENHVIYTINKDILKNYNLPCLEGAASERIFYYSAKWNFYYTCKQLAKLLPNNEAIIAAHDWLELGMVSCLGLQNLVVLYIHGDYNYYYQLAEKNEKGIDLFIPVAENISVKLKKLLPHRNLDISYMRFPVPGIPYNNEKRINRNIIFVGRCETAKGFHLLPLIARKILEKGLNMHWHIVGNEENKGIDGIVWDKRIQVSFFGNISNKDLLKILPVMLIILLPSIAEGMPVSLIEAMKAGVIPVVNDIPGGIQELVFNNKTGYKISSNKIDGYVDKIIEVCYNDENMKFMSQNCITMANQLFDPTRNTTIIEEVLVTINNFPKKKKLPIKAYGSRMDEPWIPNIITKLYRTIFPSIGMKRLKRNNAKN